MSQGLPVIYSRRQGFDGQPKDGEVGYSVQHDSTEEITKNEKILIIIVKCQKVLIKSRNLLV